jgi:hypothetical protein
VDLASGEHNQQDGNRSIRARQRAIGRELRRMYDNVANEAVPEEFLSLLQKIDVHGGQNGNDDS